MRIINNDIVFSKTEKINIKLTFKINITLTKDKLMEEKSFKTEIYGIAYIIASSKIIEGLRLLLHYNLFDIFEVLFLNFFSYSDTVRFNTMLCNINIKVF